MGIALSAQRVQIVRIHPIDRTAHHIGHAALAEVRGGMPAIATVVGGVVIAHGSAAIEEFKRAVLNHFGVQAAIRRVVDVLKEQADHSGLNRDAFFMGKVQLHVFVILSHWCVVWRRRSVKNMKVCLSFCG